MIDRQVHLVDFPKKANEIGLKQLQKAPDNFFYKIVAKHYIESTEDDNILLLLMNKLAPEGELELAGVDMLEIARLIYTGDMDMNSFRALVQQSQRLYSIDELLELFMSNQWSVISLNTKNTEYYVTLKKPSR